MCTTDFGDSDEILYVFSNVASSTAKPPRTIESQNDLSQSEEDLGMMVVKL